MKLPPKICDTSNLILIFSFLTKQSQEGREPPLVIQDPTHPLGHLVNSVSYNRMILLWLHWDAYIVIAMHVRPPVHAIIPVFHRIGCRSLLRLTDSVPSQGFFCILPNNIQVRYVGLIGDDVFRLIGSFEFIHGWFMPKVVLVIFRAHRGFSGET